MSPPAPRPSTYLTVVVISTLTIVLQLVHTRVLSFMFWSHVVYLLVYVALLGYGTAGAVGALLDRETLEKPGMAYVNLVGFAVSNVGVLWMISRMAARDPAAFTFGAAGMNVWALVGSYALCALPYFFLGLALVSVFARYRTSFNLLYAVDLAGAALGAVLFVTLLAPLGAPRFIFLLSLLAALVGGAGVVVAVPAARRVPAVAGVAAVVVFLGWGSGHTDAVFNLRPLPSKLMGTAMDLRRNPGFHLLDTSWNPVGRLDIFRAESGKLLDLGPVQVPVGFLTLTYDGDAFTAFPPTDPDWPTEEDRRRFHEPAPHDRYIEATPYLWHPKASVLVIGVGGGADMRVAQLESAARVDGVEINRSTIDAMTGRFAEDSGRIYLRPNTRVFAGDGRSFLMNSRGTWDIIHMTGIDTFLAASNGSFVMAENYLYTVDAVKSYYEHLSPQGIYTCVRWEFPERPRELLRVFSNALQALRELGVPDPTRHLVVTSFGGGQAILMMQRSPYTDEQLAAIVDRAAIAGEELIFVPGRDTNGPTGRIYQSLAQGYQTKREWAFFNAYEYDVSPVRDDRPFFYQYYRFSRLLEAVRTGEILRTAQQHGYWPFIVLAAVFVQGVVLVTLFIFGPLFLWRRSGLVVRGAAPLAIYFAALGMAYIMIELALMQKFALLLGDPIYSIMIVLGSMLVFTGIGSFLSGRVGVNLSGALARVLSGVLTLILVILIGLDPLVHTVLGSPFALRALVAVFICGPLCLGLGFFFPLGIRVVNQSSPGFLPWAWGINGGFSVIGSVATVALALALGFKAVIGGAGFVYAIGVLGLTRFCRDASTQPDVEPMAAASH